VTHDVVVHGIPRTKKTSNVVTTVKGRHIVLPSKDWRDWVRDAEITIRGIPFVKHKGGLPRLVHRHQVPEVELWTPLAVPLNCAATFYLGNRQHGDTVGYMQGLADLLEERQVIENDRLLATWDGSRLVHDGSTPRVELTLEPVPLTLE
jgi:hypothetical protein